MSLIGNHLLMDIYTSSKPALNDTITMQNIVSVILEELKVVPIGIQCHSLDKDGVLCTVLLNEGQMSIRTYPDYRYVALDFFIEPTFQYEKELIRAIKTHLSAEKTKVTHIKRGDLGTLADMKPRTKTTSGPIRKVKDTSNKVIRMLKRK